MAPSSSPRHGTPTGLVVSDGGIDLVARPAAETRLDDLRAMFAAQYAGRLYKRLRAHTKAMAAV
ncbi:hypothetical protein [Phytohabitans suffuscus]|uniref:Uncharacterized protein n=1 Tax=Phytohabitans suffuscus TaxID=624315 RepID=A0A6F8YFQ7_9ACTN|nr:hypothetical protein [Phytohabitans suffuscus]BCB84849.1 hypothetical protein Psuf_021620 [Phytohabitans suffuscus]